MADGGRTTATVGLALLAVLVAATTLLAGTPVDAGASGASGASGPPAQVTIGCADAGTRATISGETHLDPGCTYTGGFDLTSSHTTLDCHGATIAGGSAGIGIVVSSPTTTPLEDVHVRNCVVDGWATGILLWRPGYLTLPEGGEYDHAFTDVTVEHSRVRRAQGVGIYVAGYVTDVTVRSSELDGNGSTGLYLDTGARGIVVDDNDVHDNGWVENGPAGTLTTFGGLTVRFWGPGREGLAVDGAHHSRITGNRFRDNAAGAIFLYKNCGEYYLTHADSWLPRRYGANDNVIEGNTFTGGLHGVWIGARMGENTYPMECSSPAYLESKLHRYVLDEATDDVVRANTFHDVTYGVHVEDDRAVVEDNVFTGSSPDQYAVVAGTRQRTEVLHHPVTGTVLRGNRSLIAGNPSPYRWTDGEAASTVTGNTAGGEAVGWCQAPSVPHNVMVMVIAFAVEPPGGPVTPTPDLTPKTLGVQPACPALVATSSTTTTAAPTTTTTAATTGAPAAVTAAPATAVAATPTVTG